MAISLSKKNIKAFKSELHQAIRNQEFSNTNVQQIEYDKDKWREFRNQKRENEKVMEWNYKEGQLVKIDLYKMGYNNQNLPQQINMFSVNSQQVTIDVSDPLIVLDKKKWKSNFEYNFVVHETILCFYNDYIIPVHPSHLMPY